MIGKHKILALIVIVLLSVGTAGPWAPSRDQVVLRARQALARRSGLAPAALTPVSEPVAVHYPLLGVVIYETKFVDEAGTTYSVAVTPAGDPVSVEELDRAEQEAYERKFGKIDRPLLQALRGRAADDVVNVAIWLKTVSEPNEVSVEAPAVQSNSGSLSGRDELKVPLFDAAALAQMQSLEQALEMAETARVERTTAPVVEELNARGYRAVPSALAPVVNVALPVRLIRAWAHRPEVDRIYAGSQFGPELNVARQVVGAKNVNDLGITGLGSSIAVIEYNGMVSASNPYLSGITRHNPYGCSVKLHTTGVVGIIKSTHSEQRGIAPDAKVWVGCGTTDAQIQTITQAANDWKADTFSLSWHGGASRTPGLMDRFFDRMMFDYVDLVVKSAGNRGTTDKLLTSPGLGYNTLTVGSFDDRNTVSTSDDVMAAYSSYVDPSSAHNDREKPEVVAPGSNIISTTTASPWVGNVGSGTSYSTPMVAGITALMYQRDVSLILWPEATKAILMATAIRNKEGAARLSEKDGAGGVWALGADMVASNQTSKGGWGANTYSCVRPTNWNVGTMNLQAGRKVRVVIVWNQNPNYTYYASKPSADLDLQIFGPLNNIVASSYSYDNTYEIAEFTPSSAGTYTIQVDNVRCELTPKRLGWAWYQP